MVKHRCPNGHVWDDSLAATVAQDSVLVCPLCGAHADTVDPKNGDPSGDTHDDGDARLVRLSAPLPQSIRDYRIVGELGRGGMGIVYRVVDSRSREFALKTLQRLDVETLARFKREFRSVAEISHPNIATVYELILDGQDCFFTMEFVDGVSLLEYVMRGFRSGSTIADDDATVAFPCVFADEDSREATYSLTQRQIERLRDTLAQLCAAIAALHGHGLLHRDVKPNNVMVTSEGRVVLLDFGLAAETSRLRLHETSEHGVFGTIGYMSPEQAASKPTTKASDWYAVGVILYRALTGRLPHRGTPLEVLQAKQRDQPCPPNAYYPACPSDLNQLCVELLAIDPADRPDERRILETLSPAELIREGIKASPNFHGKAELIGRELQLAQLNELFVLLEQGTPVNVFVHGESGMGKTALLNCFLESIARRCGAVIFRGRCYERESVPFKAFDNLIEDIANYLRRLGSPHSLSFMPRDVVALTHVFPVFRRVSGYEVAPRRQTEMCEQHQVRSRAFLALRELLARMGDRMPVVLVIDDLQWGDEDSAVLLSQLIQPPDSPLIMIVGSYRSDEIATSKFLIALKDCRGNPVAFEQVAVEPLTSESAKCVAMSLLNASGHARNEWASLVANESAGNPYLLVELVAHLRSTLTSRAATPIFDGVSVRDAIWSRTEKLPLASRRLLEIVSVAGQPIALEIACRASGLSSDEKSILVKMKAEHFLRTLGGDEGDGLLDTYHDRVRESVIAQLDESTCRAHHLVLASTIEERGGSGVSQMRDRSGYAHSHFVMDNVNVDRETWQRIFDLSYHFHAAREFDRALPYALIAARQAHGQHSLESAEKQYRIAERCATNSDKPTRFVIHRGLADVLMLRGDYPSASRHLSVARGLAEGKSERAEIIGMQGELEFKRGDMAIASRYVEEALVTLGKRVSASNLRLYASLSKELVQQLMHTLFPAAFVGRCSLDESADKLLVARLFSRLAYAYWYTRGPIASLWAHISEMNLAEKFPPSPALAQAYSEHAVAASAFPRFAKRGIRFAERSLEIRRKFGDIWGQGQSLSFFGALLYSISRFEECIERCKEAVDLLASTGDFWEINIARYHIAACHYRLGKLSDAANQAEQIYRSGMELGDVQATGISLDIWSKATCGKVPNEYMRRELERPRTDIQAAAQLWQAEGVKRLYGGDIKEAVLSFERAAQAVHDSHVMNTWTAPIYSWLCTALRTQFQQMDGKPHIMEKQLIQRARHAARRALRIARRFSNDLPHALRESAWLAAIDAQENRARRFIDGSLEIAERQNAVLEVALSSLARGEIGRRFEWPTVESDIDRGHDLLRLANASPTSYDDVNAT